MLSCVECELIPEGMQRRWRSAYRDRRRPGGNSHESRLDRRVVISSGAISLSWAGADVPVRVCVAGCGANSTRSAASTQLNFDGWRAGRDGPTVHRRPGGGDHRIRQWARRSCGPAGRHRRRPEAEQRDQEQLVEALFEPVRPDRASVGCGGYERPRSDFARAQTRQSRPAVAGREGDEMMRGATGQADRVSLGFWLPRAVSS